MASIGNSCGSYFTTVSLCSTPETGCTKEMTSPGSASGSVGVILADDNPSGAAIHKACSALHFQPAENIEWRIYFRERLMEDVEVELPL